MGSRRVALSFAVLALFADAAVAHAGDASPTIVADMPDDNIYGGAPAGMCEWPSAVFLGGCTGTLVHPEVVIYAAHCGTSVDWAWFGENSNQQQGTYVGTEFCSTIPGGTPGYGNDFAVCKLAEPVSDVPIVPILMGCETEVLQPGVEVWLVGFGETDTGDFGTKYEVAVELQGIENDEALLGGGGTAPCYGDSGGPAYVQLPADLDPEQSWRVFGITSWGGECGTGGYYSMMHNGMDWFESETGIDVTPCHDADGTWNPGPDCHSFPLDPGVGVGMWPACGAGAVSGAGATCGEGGPDPGTSSGDDGSASEGPAADDGHDDVADTGGDPPTHETDDAGPLAESGGEGGETGDDDDGGDESDDRPALPPGHGLNGEVADGCACAAVEDAPARMLAFAALVLAATHRRRARASKRG